MRLIDADAITRSTELTSKIVTHDFTPYIKVQDLLDFIHKLPTAYDVEKVVDVVREDGYSMGLDESQTEIIIKDIGKDGVDD